LSLAGAVLGRREPKRARADLVCGITAARLTLEIELGLRVRAAAIAFQPPGAPVDDLLAGIVDDTGARAGRRDDGFGFTWLTLAGRSLDDLAIAIGVVAEAFDRTGRWEQLVCAVFAFEDEPRASVYWIYNFARGSFHAFVPRGGDRRDQDAERRLHAAAARDLRLEQDPQRRYAIWDIPV
jgi:hypothetical protein